MVEGYSNDHNPCDHPRLLLLCHSQRQYSNDAFIRFLAVMSFSSFSCCCCCCCCCPCIHRSKCGCRGQCNGYRTLLWKLLGRQTTDFLSILHTSKAKHHTNNTAKHWDIDAFTCCYKICNIVSSFSFSTNVTHITILD